MTVTARPCGAELRLLLPDEAATDRLGGALGGSLAAGDAVMLSGPLGAGKSALARAIIRARLREPRAEVPSPTYTLVNVFEAGAAGEIWHADLYRLSDPEELAELGLDDAWHRAIVLVEWPERLGESRPRRRLDVALRPTDGGARSATIRAHGAGWEKVMDAVGGKA